MHRSVQCLTNEDQPSHLCPADLKPEERKTCQNIYNCKLANQSHLSGAWRTGFMVDVSACPFQKYRINFGETGPLTDNGEGEQCNSSGWASGHPGGSQPIFTACVLQASCPRTARKSKGWKVLVKMGSISWLSWESSWRWASQLSHYFQTGLRASSPGSPDPLSHPPFCRMFLICLSGVLCWNALWPPQGVHDTGSRRLWEFLWGLWAQVGMLGLRRACRLGDPRRRLTLLTGTFSPKHRLHNPTECPYNGSRRDDCQCRKDYTAAGFSSFQKIRIDLTTMQIISKFCRMPWGTCSSVSPWRQWHILLRG